MYTCVMYAWLTRSRGATGFFNAAGGIFDGIGKFVDSGGKI